MISVIVGLSKFEVAIVIKNVIEVVIVQGVKRLNKKDKRVKIVYSFKLQKQAPLFYVGNKIKKVRFFSKSIEKI